MPRFAFALGAAICLIFQSTGGLAQCPPEPPLQNFTGPGNVACPCFVPGEQAGAVLTAPVAHYPLEILKIGIGWGSQFGGNPAQIEQALHVYSSGLPIPGAPIFTLLGPQLTDGVINLYDIEPIPGEVKIPSGAFMVSLEFLNQSAGQFFAPSVVHDGNGCQPGKNSVFAIPGGWLDACPLGVTGDWVMYVIYRPCIPTAVGDGPFVASSTPAFLFDPRPNPFGSSTEIEFLLADAGFVEVNVFDVTGRQVATLASETYVEGTHSVFWSGNDNSGSVLPSGVYFVRMDAAGLTSVRKVLWSK